MILQFKYTIKDSNACYQNTNTCVMHFKACIRGFGHQVLESMSEYIKWLYGAVRSLYKEMKGKEGLE